MRDKNVTSAILGGLDLYMAFVWLGKHLFQAIGWVEWAQGLGAVMAVIPGISLNWDAVYGFAFAGLTGALVGVNIDRIQGWRRNRAIRKHRTWNMLAEAAIKYIADDSYYGMNLDKDDRYKDAATSFWAHAQKHWLKTALRKKSEGALVYLTKRHFSRASIDIKYGANSYEGTEPKKVKVFLDVGKDGIEEYDAIYCDWYEVKQIWNPK